MTDRPKCYSDINESGGEISSLPDEFSSVTSAADKTERKAVSMHELSEENTRAILSSLSSQIAVVDHEGVLIATNPAWDKFENRTENGKSRCVVGTNYLQYCAEELRANKSCNPKTAAIFEKIIHGLQSILRSERDEFLLEYPSHSLNRLRWFLLQATLLRHPKGGVVVARQDITKRKTAEMKTRESAQRLRSILSTASDAIITIDGRGIIDSVNQATETIFRYSKAELVGQNVSMLMPLPYRDEHDGYLQRFLATGESKMIGNSREVICQTKDGKIFPADLAVSQVDHMRLFTGVLRDISSRKQMQKHALNIAAEEQRRIGLELHDGTQQELTGLALFANALIEMIEGSRLQHSVAGEEYLKVPQLDYDKFLDTTRLLAERLREANRNVRDLAHGIMPVQVDAEGLTSALHELVETTNSIQTKCSLRCFGGIEFLHNNTATHLYRIVQEAVNNALCHGSPSEIEVSLQKDEESIVLEIRDNGVGFPSLNRTDSSEAGMGLKTMEYRAGLIGGTLQILNLPTGGTLLKCLILHEVIDDAK